ncbi:MAG: AAA family ATPase [Bacteroidaceae bacterium]|nr:AAA family ATPase [Bacteroidaceae bacterium]
MLYCAKTNRENLFIDDMSNSRELVMFSVFNKVYVNGELIDGSFILLLVREHTSSHEGRMIVSYPKYAKYKMPDGSIVHNEKTMNKIAESIGISAHDTWFVYDLSVANQDSLLINACAAGTDKYKQYVGTSKERSKEWGEIVDASNNVSNLFIKQILSVPPLFRPYITAIKSKPFLLLAGISGTGKSRIVRELARACWEEGSKEYKDPKPKNFEMVQVKPNWHDSSELIGYVSRVSGSPVFVAGDFLKFVAKAWENPVVPYFLCLDEMNLAPVEQYFAEYLSVVESRKADENGVITTDPILKKCEEQWYFDLTTQLTRDDEVRARFNKDGISIPQNLIVVGTVNMDETTFSFSRKVLDRAMTIEMNEVDLYGGLDDRHEKIGKLEAGNLIGTTVEGVDVYRENKEVCDTALKYLQAVNLDLDGTPFKVAYRTRNEFLLYVVNNLPYNKDKEGNEISQQEVIARALDEVTSMKILSRIEGDSDKIGNLLEELGKTVSEQLKDISGKDYSEKKNDGEKVYSVSLAKLKEMEGRLKSGYTSFWS